MPKPRHGWPRPTLRGAHASWRQLMNTTEMLALARTDLACFAIASFPGFELAEHLKIVIERLEAVERGELKRLILCMPPRHGKSLLASTLFPAWYLGRHPDHHV